MTKTLKQALIDAATFFEAHPNAVAGGALATDKDCELVRPTDPNACRWCGLGRVVKELELTEIGCMTVTATRALRELGLASGDITRILEANDVLHNPAPVLREVAEHV